MPQDFVKAVEDLERMESQPWWHKDRWWLRLMRLIPLRLKIAWWQWQERRDA